MKLLKLSENVIPTKQVTEIISFNLSDTFPALTARRYLLRRYL